MKKIKVYLAGSIFYEKDIMFNKYLATELRKAYPDMELYSPCENTDINDKTKFADDIMIYNGDYARLKETDILIACIDADVCPVGTACEIGIFSEMCRVNSNKKIIALFTDSRDGYKTCIPEKIHALQTKTAQSQFSYTNLFLVGVINMYGRIVNSSEELFEVMHNLYLQKNKTVPTCGIYKITNNLTGKAYIGQSVHIEERFYQHKAYRGVDHGSAIDQALKKYGIENFTFEILHCCNSEYLDDLETSCIQQYNTLAPNGYNLTPGGDSGSVFNQKEVSCYSLDGKLLATYKSIRDAARQTGYMRDGISDCCHNTAFTTGDVTWRFGHENSIHFIKPKAGRHGGKTIYQYDLITKKLIQEFNSVADASRNLGDINYNKNISNAARGKRRCAYGYIWSYYYWDVAPDTYNFINKGDKPYE